jgi:hypothetical protein
VFGGYKIICIQTTSFSLRIFNDKKKREKKRRDVEADDKTVFTVNILLHL